MAYWLMKSEPDEVSIDDLAARPDQTVPWFGVRNYQARNFMRDAMAVGDQVFFYHSGCAEPGIAGLCRIASTSYPDATQFDRSLFLRVETAVQNSLPRNSLNYRCHYYCHYCFKSESHQEYVLLLSSRSSSRVIWSILRSRCAIRLSRALRSALKLGAWP